MLEEPQPKLFMQKLPVGGWIGIGLITIALAFFFGMQYQKELDGKFNPYPNPSGEPMSTMAPLPSSSTSTSTQTIPPQATACKQDSDCMLFNKDDLATNNICCHNNSCYGKEDSMIAVNKQLYEQAKTMYCSKQQVCPMYAIQCTKAQVESGRITKAICSSGMCKKVKTNE